MSSTRSMAKLRGFLKNRCKDSGDDWNLALLILGEVEQDLDSLYLRLPCDSEGAPIHPGDELVRNSQGKNETIKVKVESVSEHEFFKHEEWEEDGCVCQTSGCNPKAFRHIQTDELTDALKQFAQNWMYTFDVEKRDALTSAWVDKIRELVGSDLSEEFACSRVAVELCPKCGRKTYVYEPCGLETHTVYEPCGLETRV